MTTRIGINGFGRIGRLTLRAINQYHKGELEVVAINELTDTKTNTHLLKWDSAYGKYPGKVEANEDSILVDGIALRVPVSIGSIIDFVANLERPVSVEQVNHLFREASEGALKGILEYSEEDLVSTDCVGSTASAIFDAPSTMMIGDTMIKVLAWYDNEWGYSCRLADLTKYISGKGL
jgi:glyceraldehyde-3-phosphate dehydrogenase/erythrose-4-phosphate dehydrogenase